MAGDARTVVALLRAVPLLVSDASAVLANLVLIVTERSVEGGKLSELVPLVIVLGLGRGGSRRDDMVDEIDAGLNFLLSVGRDEAVKVVIGVVGVGLGPALAILDGALATNRYLGARLSLHLFERVSTRTDEESEELDLRELLNGDVDLVLRPVVALLGVIFGRRAVIRVELHGLIDESDALVLEFAAVSDLARVGTSSMGVVSRRRGRGSK